VTFKQITQRIRVPAGFALAPLLFISARPSSSSLAAGAFVAVIGLAIRAWGSGHLRKNQELATSGPYAHTRNPLYLGTFLLGMGVAIGGGAAWFAAVFAAVYLAIYIPVMLAERDTMRDLFSDEYAEYSKHVPLFVPRFTPYGGHSANSYAAQLKRPMWRAGPQFELSLYMRHREYRAALGFAVIYALLATKMFF